MARSDRSSWWQNEQIVQAFKSTADLIFAPSLLYTCWTASSSMTQRQVKQHFILSIVTVVSSAISKYFSTYKIITPKAPAHSHSSQSRRKGISTRQSVPVAPTRERTTREKVAELGFYATIQGNTYCVNLSHTLMKLLDNPFTTTSFDRVIDEAFTFISDPCKKRRDGTYHSFNALAWVIPHQTEVREIAIAMQASNKKRCIDVGAGCALMGALLKTIGTSYHAHELLSFSRRIDSAFGFKSFVKDRNITYHEDPNDLSYLEGQSKESTLLLIFPDLESNSDIAYQATKKFLEDARHHKTTASVIFLGEFLDYSLASQRKVHSINAGDQFFTFVHQHFNATTTPGSRITHLTSKDVHQHFNATTTPGSRITHLTSKDEQSWKISKLLKMAWCCCCARSKA